MLYKLAFKFNLLLRQGMYLFIPSKAYINGNHEYCGYCPAVR